MTTKKTTKFRDVGKGTRRIFKALETGVAFTIAQLMRLTGLRYRSAQRAVEIYAFRIGKKPRKFPAPRGPHLARGRPATSVQFARAK